MAFVIKKSIQICSSAGTNKDRMRIVHDTENVNGTEFMPLSWHNRAVCDLFVESKAKGGWTGWPRSITDVFKKARDDAVDSIIKTYLKDKDPMAEGEIVMSEKTRNKTFHEANVPSTVSIKMAPFTTDVGKPVAAIDIQFLAAPKRGAKVYIEMTVESLAWMKLFCTKTASGDESDDDDDEAGDEMLSLLRTWLPQNINLMKTKKRNGKRKNRFVIHAWGQNKKRKQRDFKFDPTAEHDEIKRSLEQNIKDLISKIDDDDAEESD
jgi:hypothetical protein